MVVQARMLTRKKVFDGRRPFEIELMLDSFAGGENTLGEDQALKKNEARVIENWELLSLGGMKRAAGINKIADGGASYSAVSDLLIYHKEAVGENLYGIITGDLVKKSTSVIAQDDAAAFTSGVLSHAISAASAIWITNSTDNLKRKTVGVAIGVPASVPATACKRIFQHKTRLLAEGSASQSSRVYGSRAGTGNWTAADAWSLANDAFNIDLPSDTEGLAPAFPSGDEDLVFTKYGAYTIYNFPNVAFRPIQNGRGCENGYTVVKGDEGVYFVSRFPTLGVFLYDGVNFIELTQNNRDVFVEKIDFTKRMFGTYRNKRYYLFYNESGSGVSYPNRCRMYDARFGSWISRPVNTNYADNFGYPAMAPQLNNEFYVASSRDDRWYEFEIGTDDEGYDTQANLKTKDFSSRDFEGGQFPLDDVRLKLAKATLSYYGTTGIVVVQWNADRGRISGQITFDLTANGAQLNSNFTVNTSYLSGTPPTQDVTKSFSNAAVGRRFSFQILQNGQSTRPIIKKLKIVAVALEEN